MIRKALLASDDLSALRQVVDAEPKNVRVLFIPTAATIEGDGSWLEDTRFWFRTRGYRVTDLELNGAMPEDLDRAFAAADLVFVSGGNTYGLLEHMQKTKFWEVIQRHDVIYSGASAGAIVACPDISFIETLDDPSVAPNIDGYAGGALVDFAILPHMDNPKFSAAAAGIVARWSSEAALVTLNDDQAVVVDETGWRVVTGP